MLYVYSTNGIRPLTPMSTTTSPSEGSKVPFELLSSHSKLLLIENEQTTTISEVSAPVISNGFTNSPVTRQEPGGIGEELCIGLGTVVAPSGACPSITGTVSYTHLTLPTKRIV